MKTANKSRSRRSPEELIADLQKRIEGIKTRAEEQKVKKSPVLRHLRKAIKALDAAAGVTEDPVTRTAVEEARSTLSACLGVHGVIVPFGSTVRPAGGRRTRRDLNDLGERLLEHLAKHPGQRGEEIASELGTDTATMRGPMKKLIAAGKVRTTGQRRAMAYSLA